MTEPKNVEAKKAGELSDGAKTYVLEKVTEDINGFIPDYDSEAMVWGIENEHKAKLIYESLNECVVTEMGFVKYNENYGGSPDGLIVENINGSLEIKCPYNSAKHLELCLIDTAEYFKKNHPNYYWQCVSHIVTTASEYCDFVSFDPRLDYEIGYFKFRLQKNEDECQRLLAKVESATKYKTQLKTRFKL